MAFNQLSSRTHFNFKGEFGRIDRNLATTWKQLNDQIRFDLALQADIQTLAALVGSVTPFVTTYKVGSPLSPQPADFIGNNVWLLSQNTVINLPSPAAVAAASASGLPLTLKVLGAYTLTVVPYAAELFEGQNIVGGKIVARAAYSQGGVYPAQTAGIYTDGISWFLVVNND